MSQFKIGDLVYTTNPLTVYTIPFDGFDVNCYVVLKSKTLLCILDLDLNNYYYICYCPNKLICVNVLNYQSYCFKHI